MSNVFNSNITTYLTIIIYFLVLLMVFRYSAKKFYLHTAKDTRESIIFIIIFFGMVVIFEYLGGFVIDLKGKHEILEILSKELFPNEYQKILIFHFKGVTFISIAFSLLIILHKVRNRNPNKEKKRSLPIDRKRVAMEKKK